MYPSTDVVIPARTFPINAHPLLWTPRAHPAPDPPGAPRTYRGGPGRHAARRGTSRGGDGGAASCYTSPHDEPPARRREHLPVSIASRLRSLKLLELRTGDGRPGPLDRRGTRRGCAA